MKDLHWLPKKVWTAPAFIFFGVLFAVLSIKAPDLETWRLTISYGVLLALVLGIDSWVSSYKEKKTRLEASGFYLGDLPVQVVAGSLITLAIMTVALVLLGQANNYQWTGSSAEVWNLIFQIGVVAFVESIVFQFVFPAWTYGIIWSQVLFGFLHWNFVLSTNPTAYFFPIFAMSIGFLWVSAIQLRTLTKKWYSRLFGLGFVIGSHATFNVLVSIYEVQVFEVVITWLNIGSILLVGLLLGLLVYVIYVLRKKLSFRSLFRLSWA